VGVHSFEESNDQSDSLLVPLNGHLKGRGGKKALKHLKANKTLGAKEEEVTQNLMAT